ncbi:MAG: hypothetical protein ACF8LL_09775 [Phycisphaerales bacterium]
MAEVYEDIEIVEDEGLVDPSEYLADIPATLISGVFGLTAFMLTCFVGLLAGNPGHVILLRAMVAMLVCAVIGRVLGIAGEICIREFVSKYKSTRPRPRKPQELLTLEAEQREHDRAVQHMKKSGEK